MSRSGGNRSEFGWREFLKYRHFDVVICLEAYFDESGADAKPEVIAVGGAVGKPLAWRSISAQWEAVLKKAGVSAYHASEFNARQGEFSGWDQAKRDRFLDGLLGSMTAQGLHAVIFSLTKSDLREVAAEFPPVFASDYEFLCYRCCICISAMYKADGGKGPTVEIVFERGQRLFRGLMEDLRTDLRDSLAVEEYGITGVTTVNKKDLIPLQVADFIVYEGFREVMRRRMGMPEEPRYPGLMLNEAIKRGYAHHMSREEIRTILDIASRHQE